MWNTLFFSLLCIPLFPIFSSPHSLNSKPTTWSGAWETHGPAHWLVFRVSFHTDFFFSLPPLSFPIFSSIFPPPHPSPSPLSPPPLCKDYKSLFVHAIPSAWNLSKMPLNCIQLWLKPTENLSQVPTAHFLPVLWTAPPSPTRHYWSSFFGSKVLDVSVCVRNILPCV